MADDPTIKALDLKLAERALVSGGGPDCDGVYEVVETATGLVLQRVDPQPPEAEIKATFHLDDGEPR